MSRFSGKTYSRVRTRDSYADKIFDELFTDEEEKTGKPTATRAVGAYQKWGNIAVTSVREMKNSQQETETKRRKVDTGLSDPFSFDSFSDEEEKIGNKKKNTTAKVSRGGAQVKSNQNNRKLLKFDNAESSDNASKPKNRYNYNARPNRTTGNFGKDTVSEGSRPAQSNSKASASQTKTFSRSKLVPLNDKTSVSSAPVVKGTSKSSTESFVENKKQMSMDFFTSKASGSSLRTTVASSDSEKVSYSQTSSDDSKDIFSQGTSSMSVSISSPSNSTLSSVGSKNVQRSPDHTYFKSNLASSNVGTSSSSAFDNDFEMDFNFSGDTQESTQRSPNKKFESRTPIEKDHAYVSPIKKSTVPEKSTSSNFNPVASTSSCVPVVCISDSDSDAVSVSSLKTEPVLEGSDTGSQDVDDEKPCPKDNLKKSGSTYGSLKSKKIFNSPKKTESKLKRLYNPRQWINKSATVDSSNHGTGSLSNSQSSATSSQASKKSALLGFDDFDSKPSEPPTLRRSVTWPKREGDQPISKLRVNVEHKQLFTVVRNVKEAHECQEHGETQEFFDDIEYLLAGLRDTQTVTTRCLSTLSLANKCIEAAFRMHLRAHGTVTKIFNALHDACCNPSLALSTAAIMYMMSRDRLNMDVDKDSLELMIKLLNMDLQSEREKKQATPRQESLRKEYERMKQKVRDVIAQLKKEGGSKNLDLNEVTTGNLAAETLLSLTARRVGDWFKEECRGMGGLDHLVDIVSDCTDSMDEDAMEVTDKMSTTLKKIDRCLRVTEHLTYLNSDNQAYLISYNSSALINSLCSLLKMLERILALYPFLDGEDADKNNIGRIIFNCMLSILKVLLNITHDNEWGGSKVGQHEGLLSSALMCALHCPQYAPGDERFDLLVLSLGMMINLVEHSEINRRLLVNLETVSYYDCPKNGKNSDTIEALDALIQLFVQKEEAAQQLEDSVSAPNSQPSQEKDKEKEKNNESGEWEESDSGLLWVIGKKKGRDGEESDEEHIEIIPSSQEHEENFTKALHKAGKHMEDSIVAAYVALLIGCIVQENGALVTRVKDQLRDGSFEPMIGVLTKFLGFMNLTNAVGNTGGKSIIKVIEVLMNT